MFYPMDPLDTIDSIHSNCPNKYKKKSQPNNVILG